MSRSLLTQVKKQTREVGFTSYSLVSGSEPSSCDCHCCNGQWIKQLFPRNRRKPGAHSVPGKQRLTGIIVWGQWAMEDCRHSPWHVSEKGEGRNHIRAPPVSQGWDWDLLVSQQEVVFHLVALEIEKDNKRVVCMQWERHTEREETENPQRVQCTLLTDTLRSMNSFCTYRIF